MKQEIPQIGTKEFNDLASAYFWGGPKQDLEKEMFEEAVKPLMKWLSENTHPHTTVIVKSNCAELVEGIKVIETNEFLID